jgi:uncharacterized UPF0160 family protein
MKRKAPNNTKTQKKKNSFSSTVQQQQSLLHRFVGKTVEEDNDKSLHHKTIAEKSTRIIPATEGCDGNAFTALLTAVATKKVILILR